VGRHQFLQKLGYRLPQNASFHAPHFRSLNRAKTHRTVRSLSLTHTNTMGFIVVRFCVFDYRHQAGGAMMCPTQLYLSSPHAVREQLSDRMKCHGVRYEYVSSTSYPTKQMQSGSYSFGSTVDGVSRVATVPIHTFLDWIAGGDSGGDWCLMGQSESVTPDGLHITYTFQQGM
jgi:hypothetical protein